jgi:hypothetical protein
MNLGLVQDFSTKKILTHTRRAVIRGAAASALTLNGAGRSFASLDTSRQISVANFGALPNGQDARPGVRAAVARLPRTGGAMLYFPPGTYHFSASPDPAIQIFGVEELTIIADQATLLFSQVAFPIVLQSCRNARLHGFSVDWNRPPFSQAEVIAVAPDGMSAVLRFEPEFPVDGTESFHAIGTYDRESQAIVAGGVDAYHVVRDTFLIADQTLRIRLTGRLPLHPGDMVVLRHDTPTYAHAITMNNCETVRLDGISIYASCAMAIVGHHCRDVLIEKVQIRPKPGSSRLLSTNADAIHMQSTTGYVRVRDCLLQGMGDDCVNVHGQYLRIADLPDARTAVIARSVARNELPRPGDTFTLSRSGTLESIGEIALAGAETGSRETLHFSADLPKTLRVGDLLCDAAPPASVSVSRCRCPGNRARGVLAHSDTVIENCFFANQSEQGILLTPALNILECGTADRVTVRNNEFHDTMRLRRPGQACITIDGPVDAARAERERADLANHGILIAGNTIAGGGGSALAANSVSGLTVDGNQIERPAGPAIVLGIVHHTLLARNRCVPTATVTVSEPSRQQVKMTDNIGLEVSK